MTAPIRVLLVDDDLAFGRAFIRVLGDRALVTFAVSAFDALELARADGNFDVVLCDLVMPGTDGIDFCGKLEALRPDLADRLVVVTGGARDARGRSFLRTHRVLPKPATRDEIVLALQEAMHGSQAA